ncbi:hypothetical protein Msi02_66930 [Microbispora siamensis]|uniref:Uncharacterized protein n=1 Tax=Microbispora siamensis TaxID=564413 RepID=A0ABQ4GWQ5_9ACTN|nr:hypothetical protein Msi02_66930 [Microbispora siamensis]
MLLRSCYEIRLNGPVAIAVLLALRGIRIAQAGSPEGTWPGAEAAIAVPFMETTIADRPDTGPSPC